MVKYFPNFDFLNAWLSSLPSYTWQSMWAAKGLLEGGFGWKVGSSEFILIQNDA